MNVVDAITASLSLPDELPPVRVSDSYSCTPTAITKVTLENKINWAGASAGECPASDEVVFMFRDILRWLVVYDHNVNGNLSKYNWIAYPGQTGFLVGVTPSTIPVTAATVDPTSGWAPHGPIIFAGEADGDGFMFLNEGNQIDITDGGAADPMLVSIYYWNHGRKNLVLSANMVGGATTTFTMNRTGYYCVELSCTIPGHIVNIDTTDVTGIYCWKHICVPDVVNNLNRITSFSMVASSLLWRNTASYDNAQGDVGAVVIGPSYDWWQAAYDSNGYTTLSENFTNGWKSFFAAKGLYTFMKPADEEDLQFRVQTRTSIPGDIPTWTYARFPLRLSTAYHALAMSVSLDAGRDTTLRAACHVQYESNDDWADVREPEANVDDWLAAAKQLSRVPNITENPVHVKDILNSIGKVGLAFNTMQTRLAPLASAAASLVPGGAALAKIGTASLPYQRRGWQYLANYGSTPSFDDGPRTNIDPRQS